MKVTIEEIQAKEENEFVSEIYTCENSFTLLTIEIQGQPNLYNAIVINKGNDFARMYTDDKFITSKNFVNYLLKEQGYVLFHGKITLEQ